LVRQRTRESGIWVLDAYTRWQAVNVDLSGKLQKAQIDNAPRACPSLSTWKRFCPRGVERYLPASRESSS